MTSRAGTVDLAEGADEADADVTGRVQALYADAERRVMEVCHESRRFRDQLGAFDERFPGGKRVLVVDDEEAYADSICRTLESIANEIDVAHSAEQAIELLRRHPYDVCVVDIMLPGETGLWLCQELRRQSMHPLAHVLLITGRIHWRHVESYVRRAGANGYLVKPFPLEELRTRVEKYFEEDRPSLEIAPVSGPPKPSK
jgi:CheY-like chemotaxis protein